MSSVSDTRIWTTTRERFLDLRPPSALQALLDARRAAELFSRADEVQVRAGAAQGTDGAALESPPCRGSS